MDRRPLLPLSADGPSEPIQCLLAFDHDRCGRWVGENAANGEPPKALKKLVELLKANIGPAERVEYTLASYSNRQSETINNKFMNNDVSNANPAVVLENGHEGKINLLWLSARIQKALKNEGLEAKAVHEKFFLEAAMDTKYAEWEREAGGDPKKTHQNFKAWCQSNLKKDLRNAIRKQFPDTKIVYLDDHCLHQPTAAEKEEHTGEVFVHLIPLTGVVEWNDCK